MIYTLNSQSQLHLSAGRGIRTDAGSKFYIKVPFILSTFRLIDRMQVTILNINYTVTPNLTTFLFGFTIGKIR